MVWNCLNLYDNNALESCKEGLISHSTGSSEDKESNRNADSSDCALGGLEKEKEDSNGNWAIIHSCYT